MTDVQIGKRIKDYFSKGVKLQVDFFFSTFVKSVSKAPISCLG